MTYSELLQQKEWWSKCNEILQRDHFTCKDCGSVGPSPTMIMKGGS